MFDFLIYGDWIGYGLILIGLLLYAPHRNWTWFAQILGYLALMGFGYFTQHLGMIIMPFLFMIICVNAFIKQDEINQTLRKIFNAEK